MTNRTTPKSLKERGRSSEEEWALRMEAARTEALRQAEAQRREREMLLARLDGDAALADVLQGFGLGADGIGVLHLVPLVELAWADGDVAPRERDRILEMARLRGVVPGSGPFERLRDWLEARPDATFFREASRAIRAVLAKRPAEHAERELRDLVTDAWSVAAAAGGLFGLRTVSPEERVLLARLADDLRFPAPASSGVRAA